MVFNNLAQTTGTGLGTSTSLNKNSTIVDQQKLSPAIQKYLLALCTASPSLFARSFVVDRAHVVPKLAEIWPGEDNEHARTLWKNIDEMVQAHPIEDVTNSKCLLNLSLAPTRMEPTLDPMRDDKISVATIDGTTGLFHRCIIPQEEKKPELCHMAIEAGLMILCQALPSARNAKNDKTAAPSSSGSLPIESEAAENGGYANLTSTPNNERAPVQKQNAQEQAIKNAANKKLTGMGLVAGALKLSRTEDNPRAPNLSQLRKKNPRDARKADKRSPSPDDTEEDNALEQEAISIALREMQLQSEALAEAQLALGLVQQLELAYFATPEEERTPQQYEALLGAYEKARLQLAIEDHHAGLAKTALAQAQHLTASMRTPTPTLDLAVHQQVALQSTESILQTSLSPEMLTTSDGTTLFQSPQAGIKIKPPHRDKDAAQVSQGPAPLLTETPL